MAILVLTAVAAVAAIPLSSLRETATQPRLAAQSSAPGPTPFEAELLAPDAAPAAVETHR